MNSHKT